MAKEYVTMNPMSEFEEENIKVMDEAVAEKFKFDPDLRGKWMMFYDKKYIDDMWQKAVSLYEAGELLGIVSIKTSTAAECARSDRPEMGVIRFACGPCDDEALILKYGLNLIKKMNYFSKYAFVAYKTDDQSRIGTVHTGAEKNYLYRLPVSTHNPLKTRSEDFSVYPIEEPSQTHDVYFLQESLYSHAVEHITEPTEYSKTLRWLMRFEKGTQHDSAWVTACRLYRRGELDGVLFLTSSTAETTIKPNNTLRNDGIIYFHCSQNELPSRLEEIGENLVRRLNYSQMNGCLTCTRSNFGGQGYTEVCRVSC